MRFLFVLCVLAVACAPKHLRADEASDERRKLAGTWVLVRGWSNGRSMAELLDAKGIEVEDFQIEVSDKALKMHGGARGPFTYAFELDTTQSPHGIDLTASDTPGRRDIVGTMKSIYLVRYNELQLCLPSSPAAKRPMEFDAPEGSGLTLLELKRKP